MGKVCVFAALPMFLLGIFLGGCGGSGGSSTSSTGSTSTTSTPPGEPESKTASFSGEEPTSEWPSVGGDVGGTRFSTADQIASANVKELKLAFAAPLDPKGVSGAGGEDNPVESEGVIYAASSSGNPSIGAYDAATGKVIWRTNALEAGVSASAAGGYINIRGLAIGGGMVYVDLPGGYLVALDQKTGKLKWKTLFNTPKAWQSSQQTPVYWDGMVYMGESGSDIIGGLHGYVRALDAKTGKVAWTFDTVPDPGTPGSQTWGSPKELKDGGGGVWTNPVIDPKLGLVYFPTGNPNPDIGGRGPGDEYYIDGVLALDLKTGKLAWFYQTTHHDEWDYDCAQPPVLWTHEVEGKSVDGLSIGCKNGYVHELDRETGKPVTPVKEEPLSNAKSDPAAKAYDEKNGWTKENGEPLTEPIPVDAGEVTPHCASKTLMPPEAPDGKGFEYACAFMYYGFGHYTAGMNDTSLDWEPSSYDPETGYTYYCANRGVYGEKLKNFDAKQKSEIEVFPQLEDATAMGEGTGEPRQGWITALNVEDDKTAWQVRDKSGIECLGGTAVTAGGVLFALDSTGHLHGYDAKTGKSLWTYSHTGLSIDAPPIAYENEGKEYLAIAGTLEGKAVLLGFALNATEPKALAPPESGSRKTGQSIFATNCGSCHTLAAAETSGSIGPNLDQLKPDEKTVQTQVENGGDKMPSFKGQLSAAEIKSVATFVADSAGKKGKAPR